MIDDWFDFIGILALDFLIIMIGVWILPQLPEHTHFIVAISVLLSAIFFAKKQIDFILGWFEQRKVKNKQEKSK